MDIIVVTRKHELYGLKTVAINQLVYVTKDNKFYHLINLSRRTKKESWQEISGSSLASTSALVLGESATNAYRGDRGKDAYDHSLTSHAPSNAEANNISDVNATDLTDGGATTLHSHAAGGGDVVGPASNTADYLPQWNGANSKTLKDGVAIPAGGLAGLTALGDKVDKVAGSSLVDDDEIAKIHAAGSDDQTLPEDLSDLTDTTYIAGGKKPYHGVESYADLAWSDANKALTLSAITYWYKGVRYSIATTVTCDLDLVADRDNSANSLATDTLYFFYFKDTTGKLYWSDSPWDFIENVFVASVFWNGTNGACQLECHNHKRDIDWHIWAHDTIGTRYESGFILTAPTTAADGTLNIGTGNIHDEDLDSTTGAMSTMRGWYKNGASTYTFRNYSLPYLGTLNNPTFLNTASNTLDTFAASDYACYWVYASLDITTPCYIMPTHGTAAFNTLNLARANTAPVIVGINNEYKLIYKFIYSGDGQFIELVDYRSSSPIPGGGTPTVSAQQVSFAIGGGLSSTNVQDALIELDTEKLNASKVSDVAYDATTWDNNTDVPTKNVVRDKLESLSSGGLSQPQIMARISIGF